MWPFTNRPANVPEPPSGGKEPGSAFQYIAFIQSEVDRRFESERAAFRRKLNRRVSLKTKTYRLQVAGFALAALTTIAVVAAGFLTGLTSDAKIQLAAAKEITRRAQEELDSINEKAGQVLADAEATKSSAESTNQNAQQAADNIQLAYRSQIGIISRLLSTIGGPADEMVRGTLQELDQRSRYLVSIVEKRGSAIPNPVLERAIIDSLADKGIRIRRVYSNACASSSRSDLLVLVLHRAEIAPMVEYIVGPIRIAVEERNGRAEQVGASEVSDASATPLGIEVNEFVVCVRSSQ